MTRFLCVGDLHIGAGREYGREPGDRLRDQEQVWTRVLELAVEHDVDAVLFAGDAFHRHTRTPAELRAFQRPIEAFAAEHEIPILGIPGNHDIESASADCVLEVFGRDIDMHFEPGLWEAAGVTVATLPWTPISRLIAARDGGDRDDSHAIAAQLLLDAARDLRARVEGPCVLMLHWSLTEAMTPTGREVGPDFGVAINTAALARVGFDAVIAGHIHKAQLLVEGDAPIFYTGSPLPVDFGEAETAHGCYLLELGGPADLWKLDFLPIESRPFVTIDVDELADESYTLALGGADVADAVVRVRIRTDESHARMIDQPTIRRVLESAGAHTVFAIQLDVVRAGRARAEGVDEDIAPLAAVDAWVSANEISTEHHAALAELTTRYLQETS